MASLTKEFVTNWLERFGRCKTLEQVVRAGMGGHQLSKQQKLLRRLRDEDEDYEP